MYFNFKIYILNMKSFSMKLIFKNDLIHEFSNQWSHFQIEFPNFRRLQIRYFARNKLWR